jgi:hypothetical protein
VAGSFGFKPGFAASPNSYFVIAVFSPESGSVNRVVWLWSLAPEASNPKSVATAVLIDDRLVAHVTVAPDGTPIGATDWVTLLCESNVINVTGRLAPAVGAGPICRVKLPRLPLIATPA